MLQILERFRFINAMPPAANPFAGTKYVAGINLQALGRVVWIVQKGVGTTGTTTVQVVAADAASPFAETPVAFKYRRIPSNNITPGTVTSGATTGFLTTAGSSDMYIIEIDAKAIAASGYHYAALKMVEGTASAVLGSVLCMATDDRWSDDTSDIVS